MSARLAAGDKLEPTLAANRIWEKRKPLIRRCLQSSSLGYWRSLLKSCARVDAMIKGRAPGGDPWDALELLGLRLAGLDMMPAALREETRIAG
jgi:DNA polymerase-3 subunit delta